MNKLTEKVFGIDGVRGKVGEYPMTIDFAMRFASSIAKVMTPNGGKVAIGFRCKLCRYLTGHRWREPSRYSFSRKGDK